MQEIADLLQKANALLAKADASKRDRGAAISLLRSAKNRLEALIATLEAQQRR
jgi:hypothetical protein